MKRFWFLLLFPFVMQAEIDPEEIDLEWLITSREQSGASDYMPQFKKVFEELKVKTFLEFGVGYETKYFLDQSTKVITVEFVTPGYGPNWIRRFLDFYRDFSNWIPIIYFSSFQGDPSWAPFKYLGSEHLYKAASYQCATHKDYALNDPFYRIELEAFINNLVKYNHIDVAFISPPMYLRGDLVQLLFGKVPVIFAYDTSVRSENVTDDVYGYSRIKTPEDYEEIYIASGSGVTAWILKTGKYVRLVEKLKNIETLE